MKLFGYISLLGLSFSLPLYAEENTLMPIIKEEQIVSDLSPIESVPIEIEITPSKPTISELVAQVQNAPDDQKRVLMNELKIQLKKMNKETREEAMKALKKSFARKGTHSQHQKQNQGNCQPLNHQPKFRHLQRGLRNGKIFNIGQGNGSK